MVASMFANLGAEVIDADQLAREVVEPGRAPGRRAPSADRAPDAARGEAQGGRHRDRKQRESREPPPAGRGDLPAVRPYDLVPRAAASQQLLNGLGKRRLEVEELCPF